MGFDARQKGLIREISAIAFPAIVTNLTTPLLGLCDIAIAGHKGGAAVIAALAVGTSMFNMLYWVFGFLRMGSSGLTAQAFGASDNKGLSLVLFRALWLGLLIGLLMTFLQCPLGTFFIAVMDVYGSTAQLARDYFGIVVWGAPAVLATYSLTGWFIGMQNTRIPMMVSLLADVVNILVSVSLVFVFDMGLRGVATGTLIAQWLSFVVAWIICRRRFSFALPPFADIIKWNGLRRFFSINTDIFLRTVCLVAVTVWFTRVGARQGSVMLAVNALLMQLFTLCSYFMDGFAFSAEALIGRFHGSGKRQELRKIIRYEIAITAVVALLFSAVYFLIGEQIIGLLTDDDTVVVAAREYLPWAVMLPLSGFLAFCCDGIAIGATATRIMLLSMLVAMALFFLLYFVLFPVIGNHGLWIAFLSYLAVRGVTLLLMLRRQL